MWGLKVDDDHNDKDLYYFFRKEIQYMISKHARIFPLF